MEAPTMPVDNEMDEFAPLPVSSNPTQSAAQEVGDAGNNADNADNNQNNNNNTNNNDNNNNSNSNNNNNDNGYPSRIKSESQSQSHSMEGSYPCTPVSQFSTMNQQHSAQSGMSSAMSAMSGISYNNNEFDYNPEIYDTDFDYHDFGDRNYDYLNSDEETNMPHMYQHDSESYDYHNMYGTDPNYYQNTATQVPMPMSGQYPTQQQQGMYGQYPQTPNMTQGQRRNPRRNGTVGGNNGQGGARRPYGAQYEYENQTNELVCSYPDCHKTYFTPRDLKRHERTHERAAQRQAQARRGGGGSQFRTPNAGPGMGRTQPRAMKAATGFECNICHKSFASRSSMRNHQKSQHSNDRPFKCSMCDKAYVAKSYLKKHFKMQHDTEKPFICNYDDCGKRFKVNYLLQAHIKNVHLQIKRFRCLACQKGFAKRYNLKQHCIKQHGVDIDVTAGYGSEL